MRNLLRKGVLLLAAAAFATGCSDDNTDPTPAPEQEKLTLALSTTVVQVSNAETLIDDIELETNGSWELVGTPTFCEVSPVSGSAGKSVVTVAVAANETDEERTETLLFRAVSDGSGSVEAGQEERTLEVTQAAGNPTPSITYGKNLSQAGIANCYVIDDAGAGNPYRFAVANRASDAANADGLPVAPEIAAVSAELVWQSAPGLIGGIALDEWDGADYPLYVAFEVTPGMTGNAVIAVRDKAGEISWSWHIWIPAGTIEGVRTATGYEVMNMNLGAMNNTPGDPTSYGMLYQWGRKDPFPAAATLLGTTATLSAPMYDAEGGEVGIGYSSWTDTSCNTLAYAIAHPTVCLSNYAQYAVSRDWLTPDESSDALWGNPRGAEKDEENNYINTGSKSCYDPCPAGWRVPPADVFEHFTSSGGYAWTFEDFNLCDINGDGVIDLNDYDYGWHFLIDDDTPLYFPAAARFDGSYAMLMGSMSGLWGSYWGNAPYPTVAGGGFSVLSFQVKDMYGNETITVSPQGGGGRADAYSVRCIRE